MPTQGQPIIIIGAGVLGLTTATLLQQRLPPSSHIVTIIASEFPDPPRNPTQTPPTASYASPWAGAHYRPIPFVPSIHPFFQTLSPDQQAFHRQLAREQVLAFETAGVMRRLAEENPECGVRVVSAGEFLEKPPVENMLLRTGDAYAWMGDGFRVLEYEDLSKVNAGVNGVGEVKWACEYQSYVINVHVYCSWLLRRFLEDGGKTIHQKLEKLHDALASFPAQTSNTTHNPIIVNCSGNGLTNDSAIQIIRGQTVLVRQQFDRTLTRQCADGSWSFLIPRPLGGGTIIGGTKQIGDLEERPREEERKKMLENAARCFPEFVGAVEGFEVLSDNVGRRPWRRGGVRIEVEEVRVGGGSGGDGGSVKVVHGYGAGGRGYELSWGVAGEICGLVEGSSSLQKSTEGVTERRSVEL